MSEFLAILSPSSLPGAIFHNTDTIDIFVLCENGTSGWQHTLRVPSGWMPALSLFVFQVGEMIKDREAVIYGGMSGKGLKVCKCVRN